MGTQRDNKEQEKGPERQRVLRILVVEDHPDTRRSLEMFLKMLGYDAQFAGTMQKALKVAAAADGRFDLLLSDLRLPDGDGWELLRRMGEDGKHPPRAIALSGWGSQDDVARSQAVGFHAHLVKPPAPAALETVLREAAEAVRAEAAEQRQALDVMPRRTTRP